MNNQWAVCCGGASQGLGCGRGRCPATEHGPWLDCDGCVDSLRRHRREAGLTLSELLIVLVILGMITITGLSLLNGRIEKVVMARCNSELRSIQSTVWTLSDGVTWPDREHFWDDAWAGKKPGPYYYFANDSDANRGHGNDMDFCDEENPGQSSRNRDCAEITFVVLCQHNHHNLANYVYIEDEGPPSYAGWSRDTNPGYDTLILERARGGRPGS